MSKNMTEDGKFNNIYDAIDYCLELNPNLKNWGYKIESEKVKNIVSHDLQNDVNKLMEVIDSSHMLRIMISKKDDITVYNTALYNLAFVIAEARDDRELMYDYDAVKLFSVYFKHIRGQNQLIDDLVKKTGESIKEDAKNHVESSAKIKMVVGCIFIAIGVFLCSTASSFWEGVLIFFLFTGIPFAVFISIYRQISLKR